MINLERAAYEAPNFIRKIQRTRKALLDDTMEQIEVPKRSGSFLTNPKKSLSGGIVRGLLATKPPPQ